MVEFTRLKKENAQRWVTNAVNVEEEIALHSNAINLETRRVDNISSTDSRSSSVGYNEDIDYIAGIAVESANAFKKDLFRNAD